MNNPRCTMIVINQLNSIQARIFYLFDMGGAMMAPQNVFVHYVEILWSVKLKLCDFYYQSLEHWKKLFLVLWCYHSN